MTGRTEKNSLFYFPNMGKFSQLQPIFILIHWMDDWRLINTKHSRDPRRTSYESASKSRSCKVPRVDCHDFQLLQRYQSLELQTAPTQNFRIQIAAASLHTLPTVHQINTGTSTGEKNQNTAAWNYFVSDRCRLCVTNWKNSRIIMKLQNLQENR